MSDTTLDVEAIAAAESKVLVFGDGASIYRRHEKGDYAYIIRRGQVEINEQGRMLGVETTDGGSLPKRLRITRIETRIQAARALDQDSGRDK